MIKEKQIKIFYFSGSGNTKLIAERFFLQMREKGFIISMFKIEDFTKNKKTVVLDSKALSFLLFPTYNFNPPHIIDLFLNLIENPVGRKFVIISSCSDPVIFNNGAIVRVRNWLILHYSNILYEDKFVMPANSFLRYPEELSMQLLRTMQIKIKKITEHIDAGKTKKMYENVFISGVSYLFRGFGFFSKSFGKSLSANGRCTACGRCIRECPSSNIIMDRGVRFGSSCLVCLRCVYNCPVGAIYSTKYQRFLFDGRYELEVLPDNKDNKKIEFTKMNWWYRRFKKYCNQE